MIALMRVAGWPSCELKGCPNPARRMPRHPVDYYLCCPHVHELVPTLRGDTCLWPFPGCTGVPA